MAEKLIDFLHAPTQVEIDQFRGKCRGIVFGSFVFDEIFQLWTDPKSWLIDQPEEKSGIASFLVGKVSLEDSRMCMKLRQGSGNLHLEIFPRNLEDLPATGWLDDDPTTARIYTYSISTPGREPFIPFYIDLPRGYKHWDRFSGQDAQDNNFLLLGGILLNVIWCFNKSSSGNGQSPNLIMR